MPAALPAPPALPATPAMPAPPATPAPSAPPAPPAALKLPATPELLEPYSVAELEAFEPGFAEKLERVREMYGEPGEIPEHILNAPVTPDVPEVPFSLLRGSFKFPTLSTKKRPRRPKAQDAPRARDAV